MNLISVFEELDKLYESEDLTEACEKEAEEALTEAAEDEEIEIIDDEAEEVTAEEAEADVMEEEPKQVIIECSKCGALVIKDEVDIEVDEETDLVNVKEECKFCEEAEGYKIVGVVAPYAVAEEAQEVEEPVEEEPVEDVIEEEPVEESAEVPAEDEAVEEGLGDWYRKKFDKPASEITQTKWEERLEELYLTLENATLSADEKAKIKKEIEAIKAKFAQQRDWEKRHEKDDELAELFDAKLNIDAQNFAGDSNKVSVMGLESFDAKEADDEDLDELFDAKVNVDARGFGGSGNNVKVL